MDKAQTGAISESGGGALDAAVDAFEAAWRSRTLPDIRSSIDKAPQTDRTALLHELVRVDLEYRWKINAGDVINGRPPSYLPYVIEDYAVQHPELGDASKLPLDLIIEEYRVRQRWGYRPDAAEFARRFPDRGRELTAQLIEVDRDLQKEVDTPSKTEFDLSPALAGLAHIPQFDYRDFVLEAHVGSGGSGKVYRAWWKSRRRHVAVKMLRKIWWRQPGAAELFFREAEILVRLRHANIVSVHGIGCTTRGACFLIIDLIDGGDVAQSAKPPIPIAQAIDWAAQAAEGLAFAHSQGVVHCDLKPSNLLLNRRGGVLIADFGLARDLSMSEGIVESLVGTAAYMAPEQFFADGRHVGPAVDVFGLGAILHTLLIGRPPYEGRDLIDIVERRLAAPRLMPLRTLRPGLPEAVERIVARCLEADPVDRYAAKELAGALRQVDLGG